MDRDNRCLLFLKHGGVIVRAFTACFHSSELSRGRQGVP